MLTDRNDGMERAASRPWLRRLAPSLMVLGGIAAGIWLAQHRSGSRTMAATANTPPPASPALTQLAESGRKLVVLRTVERQASADLGQVRATLEASTMSLSPEQARLARAVVKAAQVAVDLAPTAVEVASRATRAAQAVACLNEASVRPHTMAAGLLSAEAAADAAQTTVAATRAAVEAARAAVYPTEMGTASRAAAAGLAAAQTAVDAAQTAVDAAQASQSALEASYQPPAFESPGTKLRNPGVPAANHSGSIVAQGAGRTVSQHRQFLTDPLRYFPRLKPDPQHEAAARKRLGQLVAWGGPMRALRSQ
jgi:hypothetical protein